MALMRYAQSDRTRTDGDHRGISQPRTEMYRSAAAPTGRQGRQWTATTSVELDDPRVVRTWTSPVSMILVNLGCGRTWHSEWLNFDICAVPPHVRRLDIRRRLPFDDRSVDAVYHSHVLEHLSREQARSLTRECQRVLKPGGVLRAVVPDLETIARLYLQSLEAALGGSSRFIYDWAMMELYDQAVRQTRGGAMATAIASATPQQRDYVESRIGRSWSSSSEMARAFELFRDSPRVFWAKARQQARGAVRTATVDTVVRLTCGRRVLEYVRLGRFRMSGETHLWMYDRFSLVQLLEDAGFSEVTVERPGESRIPGFGRFGLEFENGTVRKPDSVFVEGILK